MAHFVRLNERVANPNPHFGFLTVLPGRNEEKAMQLLKALAAQVRRVCKNEGLQVNSFEEYAHNRVFAGRNWNNGEVIELVLRKPNGNFYSVDWLLRVLCHELAHNLHMNHGPAFQKFMRELQRQVDELRADGHFGEGFWSVGQELGSGLDVTDNPTVREDLAEHLCGGHQNRRRPTSSKRRRTGLSFASTSGPRPGQPSRFTGRQTAKKRKSGGRNETVFKRMEEEGAVGGRLDGEQVLSKELKAQLSAARVKAKAKGKAVPAEVDSALGTHHKSAKSRAAAAIRAEAAERRLRLSQGLPADSDSEEDIEDFAFEDDGVAVKLEEYEPVQEADADRRATYMRAAHENGENESDEEDDAWVAYEREAARAQRARATAAASPKGGSAGVRGSKGKAESELKGGKGKASANVPEPLFFGAESSDDDEEVQFVGQSQGPSSSTFKAASSSKSARSASSFRSVSPLKPVPAWRSNAASVSAPPRPAPAPASRPTSSSLSALAVGPRVPGPLPPPTPLHDGSEMRASLLRQELADYAARRRGQRLSDLGLAGKGTSKTLGGGGGGGKG